MALKTNTQSLLDNLQRQKEIIRSRKTPQQEIAELEAQEQRIKAEAAQAAEAERLQKLQPVYERERTVWIRYCNWLAEAPEIWDTMLRVGEEIAGLRGKSQKPFATDLLRLAMTEKVFLDKNKLSERS